MKFINKLYVALYEVAVTSFFTPETIEKEGRPTAHIISLLMFPFDRVKLNAIIIIKHRLVTLFQERIFMRFKKNVTQIYKILCLKSYQIYF